MSQENKELYGYREVSIEDIEPLLELGQTALEHGDYEISRESFHLLGNVIGEVFNASTKEEYSDGQLLLSTTLFNYLQAARRITFADEE
jgi:hypothetical protein